MRPHPNPLPGYLERGQERPRVPTDELDTAMSTASDNKPFVSIIIPVYNDGERLRTCLTALSKQTYPAERFEVLVIDNGSKVSPGPIVADFPFAKLSIETRPGSYCARNNGLALAKGEMFAFTDADCV